MRKSRFTEAQIVLALKQVQAGVPMAEICRKYGISEKTYYLWRKRYGNLTASELGELRQLREENRQLKRMVADLALDKQVLADALTKKL